MHPAVTIVNSGFSDFLYTQAQRTLVCRNGAVPIRTVAYLQRILPHDFVEAKSGNQLRTLLVSVPLDIVRELYPLILSNLVGANRQLLT